MADAVQIGKAAKLAGISVDTIRFYQKLGLIDRAIRSVGGYRLFDGQQIRDLKFVRHAQELGFSLTEIKELLGATAKATRLFRSAVHAQAQTERRARKDQEPSPFGSGA